MNNAHSELKMVRKCFSKKTLCKKNHSQQNPRRVVFKYISFKLGYNFSSCCYNVFSTDFPLPHPWRISHNIYPFLANFGSPFVDYLCHYSNVCPIRRPPQSSVSCGNQDSTVQGSSPHKCSKRVWWGPINVVATSISSIMSWLTPDTWHYYLI